MSGPIQNVGSVPLASQIADVIAQPVRVRGGIRPGPVEDLNFVIVFLDDGGAEWFNWSGLAEPNAGHALTPRLDELRQLGVTFTRGFATPICAPSRARLWSSTYGFDTGCAGNPLETEDFRFCGGGAPISDWQNPDPITLRLLPRLLNLGCNGQDTGLLSSFKYAKGHFGKSHLHGHEGTETWPCDHGIGRYIGCQPNAGVLPIGDSNTGHFHFTEITQNAGGAPSSKVWGSAGTWPAGGPYVAYDLSPTPDAAWDAYTNYRNAIQWINTRTGPFLAMVCFNPPHAPFEVPPYTAPDDVGEGAPGGTFNLLSAGTQAAMTALDGGGKGPGYEVSGASVLPVYRANIEAVDTLIGKLWDRMEPVRRAKTVFIVVGDNGTVTQAVDAPYLGDHGKRSIYEMGARVPFLIWGPPSVITQPNRDCDHLVHVVDIMPTVLQLARADPALWNPGGARKVRGVSLATTLRNPNAAPARSFVFNEFFSPMNATLANGLINAATWFKCYSDGEFKVIQRGAGSLSEAGFEWEFYCVTADEQPESGEAGYFEREVDDLYPNVGQPGHEATTARFNELAAAMAALIAS